MTSPARRNTLFIILCLFVWVVETVCGDTNTEIALNAHDRAKIYPASTECNRLIYWEIA